ncbi:MAG: replicative DNA helicase [Pseudomonadota bacterium]
MDETLPAVVPDGATDPAAAFRVLPHSLEAEQALLGAILVNNEAFHRVADYLQAEHFYEPVHARLFEAIARRIADGYLADPVTLKRLFDDDEGLREVDGSVYLAKLARAAESIVNAEHYGRLLHDLAIRRGLIAVGEEVVTQAYDPSTEADGQEQIEGAESRLFALAETGVVQREYRLFPEVLTSTIQMVESAYHKQGKVTGVPTGLTGLDEKLGGLQPSDLVILAARPSMGKTALALTIAANAAAQPVYGADAERLQHDHHTVGFFSLEMSGEQLAMRLLSAESRIGSDDLRKGQIAGDADWQRLVGASQALTQRPLYIDDTPALSVSALRTRSRRLMRRFGISLIVVDYLQLLRGTSRQSQGNRVLEIGEITMTLKAIAKELKVPVLALSQLSRQVESREDKRPLLSDLRDSGTIEQDADVVMFLYREEYYMSRAVPQQRESEKPEDFTKRYQDWYRRLGDLHNKAEVIVAKQRNGPIGPVTLQFDANYGRFYNYDPDPRNALEPL